MTDDNWWYTDQIEFLKKRKDRLFYNMCHSLCGILSKEVKVCYRCEFRCPCEDGNACMHNDYSEVSKVVC